MSERRLWLIKIIKKIIALLSALVIFLSLSACVKEKNTPPNDTEPVSKSQLVRIVDLTEVNQIATDTAFEPFYSDGKFTYCFPTIRSEYVECVFSDGSKMKFTEALENGIVSVSDLDSNDIQYWIKDKDGNYTNSLDVLREKPKR